MSNLVQAKKDEKIQQAKEEYYRLLYVAMTRAENELYVAALSEDESDESWYKIIKNSIEDLKTKC